MVKHVDCYTITYQELQSITTSFKFQSMMRAPLHGFAFWFDVEFSGPA
nr:probable protein arginine N-methyltransferase 6 [Tanacetum cinerariifolium]